MALQSHQRRKKPLLYSDLFKPSYSATPEENTSSISSSSTTQSPSSSSSINTPLQYSELEDDDEDGDFITELTRRMTECMLEEDEKEKNKEQRYLDHGNNLKSGRDRVDRGISPSQVYELKNIQPVVTKRVDVDGVEAAQQKQNYSQYRGRNGSDMQVVFLGSKKMSGTGVFLPQAPTRRKNKSAGCSIVLMPTRVLHALELHFNKQIHYPSSRGSQFHSCTKDGSVEKEGDEIQLPQEWTY